MRRLTPDELVRYLAVSLRLVPQQLRRRWADRHVIDRDAAAGENARRLVEALRDHAVLAPERKTRNVCMGAEAARVRAEREREREALAAAAGAPADADGGSYSRGAASDPRA